MTVRHVTCRVSYSGHSWAERACNRAGQDQIKSTRLPSQAVSKHPDCASEVSLRGASYETFGDDLFQLTLSYDNKAEIFQYALSKLDQSQYEASSILEKLAQWNAHTATLFTTRSSTTVLDTPFRLIFPNSALPAFDETGLYVRQYAAVSYCWLSTELWPERYERYGDWPISKPFVDAILEDKGHHRQGIWMDQLCIDQTSVIDKQRSVAVMDVIYRSCIRLLVLLEDVSFNEQEAALCERYDPKKNLAPYKRSSVPSEVDTDVIASCYYKVNSARWWERAWCHHEFSVNEPWSEKRQVSKIHNATFIVHGPEGSTVKIKWYTLHKIMVTALRFVPELAGTLTTEAKGFIMLTGIDQVECEPDRRFSIMAKYNGLSRKDCLHFEDKLSVMINMCGIALAYQGHAITNRDEVFYLSTVLAFAAGEAYPLTMFHGEAPIRFGGRSTWLQRHYTGDDITIPRFKPGSLHGIHRVSMQEIDLNMLFLCQTPKWEEVKDQNLGLTYDVFPNTIPTTHPTRLGWNDSYRDQDETLLDKSRRRFLMSCIVQGHSFTVRLWAQLKRDVLGPNYNQGLYNDLGPNPFLYDAARRLVAQLLPVSSMLCIPPPFGFTFEDAQLFLAWLTDPRSIHYISTFTYQTQCTLDGQRALVTAVHTSKSFKDGLFSDLRAAVPTDLMHGPCTPLRVWLLQPRKSEFGVERWKLVGKAMLLGEPELVSEAKGSKRNNNSMLLLKRAVISGWP